LLIQYPSTKHQEVTSILETVSNFVNYTFAEFNCEKTQPFNNCSYSFEIETNYQYYVPIQIPITDTIFSINPPDLVFMGFEFTTSFASLYDASYPMLIKSVTDITDCTTVNYNLAFAVRENILYCFPDGQAFFIEDIINKYCPYCIEDCFSHGRLELHMQVIDSNRNTFKHVHWSDYNHPLSNGWIISIPTTGNESGCEYIDEVVLIILM